MRTTTRLLNTEAIANADLQDEPFRWALMEQSFTSPDHAEALRRTFPSSGFGTKRRRLGESSTYGGHFLHGRGLVTRETGEIFAPDELDPLWVQLADELMSDDYRDAVQELTGIDLSDTQRELICFRQPVGGFLDPHPDNPKKRVSHVFYFSDPSWAPSDGGCLRILRSRAFDDIYAEIEPTVDRSVILVRSDESWHGYPPVESDRNGERLALQLFFCSKDMQFATEYGPDWTKAPRVTRPLWSAEAR
jgi:SM-20-related protein